MTSKDHADEWHKHTEAAEELLYRAVGDVHPDNAPVYVAMAQAHATLAHTHAYLMVEGLR